MARVSKPVSATTGHRTKEEKRCRAAIENILSGGTEKIKAPTFLTLPQRRIFKFIVEELTAAKILGNLDLYVLTQAAITVERIQTIDKEINENNNLLTSTKIHNIRSKYMTEFFRLCNELSLSPVSRAKIGTSITNGKKEEVDPLMKVLKQQ